MSLSTRIGRIEKRSPQINLVTVHRVETQYAGDGSGLEQSDAESEEKSLTQSRKDAKKTAGLSLCVFAALREVFIWRSRFGVARNPRENRERLRSEKLEKDRK